MFTKTLRDRYQCALLTQSKDYCDSNVNADVAFFELRSRNVLQCGNRNWCRAIIFLILNLSMLHCLPTASTAPQSCILCDKDDIAAKDPRHTNYEEFLFEHQVTRQDAINALKSLNQSFYEGPSTDSSCKAITCSNDIKKYCLGPQFINDHCWCELGHNHEGLPFVPHICYVGEKAHKAFGGSCFLYEEVKECCCASALAKQWRHISSTTRSLPNLFNCIVTLLISLLVIC